MTAEQAGQPAVESASIEQHQRTAGFRNTTASAAPKP